MFYKKVFKEFNTRKIKYLVIGGVAVNLHGIPRVTQDIDILIDMDPGNVLKLINCLKSLGYKAKAPVKPEGLMDPNIRKKWIKEKNMKVFNFIHPLVSMQEIDILIDTPVNFKDVYKDKVMKKIENLRFPIVSAKNLIKMKKKIGRKTDISDIRMLKLLIKMGEK